MDPSKFKQVVIGVSEEGFLVNLLGHFTLHVKLPESARVGLADQLLRTIGQSVSLTEEQLLAVTVLLSRPGLLEELQRRIETEQPIEWKDE